MSGSTTPKSDVSSNSSMCDDCLSNDEDDDDDGKYNFNDEYNDSVLQQPEEYDDAYKFQVIDNAQIEEILNAAIEKIVDIINVNKTEARHLLKCFEWKTEKLIDDFLQSDNENEFRQKVHLPLKSSVTNVKTMIEEVPLECEICCVTEDDEIKLARANYCGHRYCLHCWNQYLDTKIVDGTDMILCAAHKCDMLIEDEMVLRLLENEKSKMKFGFDIINMFVQSNPLIRWCPAVDCIYAITVNEVQARPVQCKCNHAFCFGCGEQAHEPINCEMAGKWDIVSTANIATCDWLNKNTKQCKQCGVHIQKNGGCNFMMCRGCNYRFCWMCGNPTDHGQHNCNQYNGPAENDASDVNNPLRRAHYATRYHNHLLSLKLEQKLYEWVEEKIQVLQEEQNIARTRVDFFHRAIETLSNSRRILCATYAFAYFTGECNQLHIFEENQRDLENATEKLSSFLENEITNENLLNVQQTLEDKFSYCKRRQKTLLDHVREGYEFGWWKTKY